MGVTRHLRKLYLCTCTVTCQNNHQLPVSEPYISHVFDMLVFLMVLCALTKKNCLLVCQQLLAILCCKKTTQV